MAQTYLFVPGNRPERFAKALASGADRVIVDLEDAVLPADKPLARRAFAEWHATADTSRVLLRINDAHSPFYADDMALLRACTLPSVMLAKAESPAQIADLQAAHSGTVLALLETARGLLAAQAIAATSGVARLAFGSIDYALDLDLPSDSPALDMAAVHLALASRAANLPAPVAGVTVALDAQVVAADMAHAQRLGFAAKMCIHPSQVSAVRTALAPSAADLAWATRVLAAYSANPTGALQLDGKMIDRPVLLKAQRLLASTSPTSPTY
ncbi:MAG: CoA ester lyase [Rhodoferax sp.]|uniref:HpcH/HpaI aldolase/citrate lyase family protein n=1 Tax=Rhodoferax sp. TaxID=50421 RepID=UPI003267A534